jgi:hypothetical protein
MPRLLHARLEVSADAAGSQASERSIVQITKPLAPLAVPRHDSCIACIAGDRAVYTLTVAPEAEEVSVVLCDWLETQSKGTGLPNEEREA